MPYQYGRDRSTRSLPPCTVLDPYYPAAHWLRGDAYLAEGKPAEAAAEARAALEIEPTNEQALVLADQAAGKVVGEPPSADDSVNEAERIVGLGNTTKALRILAQAVRRSPGGCPRCHRLSASLYESMKST